MSEPRPSLNAASIRGLAVLGVAVLLGFVLLSRSEELAPSTEARSDRPTSTTSSTTSTPLLTPTTSATTTPAAAGGEVRPPEQVNVIVLNASGGLARGVAGTTTAKLADLGYKTVEPGNAVARDTSVVYFSEGFEAEASAIKQGLGLPGAVEPVQDLPTAEAQGADVIVVLGGDAAALASDDGTASPGGTAPDAGGTTPSTDPTTPSTDPTTPSTDPTTPSTDPTTPSTESTGTGTDADED